MTTVEEEETMAEMIGGEMQGRQKADTPPAHAT